MLLGIRSAQVQLRFRPLVYKGSSRFSGLLSCRRRRRSLGDAASISPAISR